MQTLVILNHIGALALFALAAYELVVCPTLAARHAFAQRNKTRSWSREVWFNLAAMNYLWRSFIWGDSWRARAGVPLYRVKTFTLWMAASVAEIVNVSHPDVSTLACIGAGAMAGVAFFGGSVAFLKTCSLKYREAMQYQEGIEQDTVFHRTRVPFKM